jgi:hypothetical protein
LRTEYKEMLIRIRKIRSKYKEDKVKDDKEDKDKDDKENKDKDKEDKKIKIRR